MKTRFTWLMAFCAAAVFSQAAAAQSWQATVGAQNNNKGRQALAFLPNEIWIHAGESVTWTFNTNEKHSVTFLTPGQLRPSFSAGCPGATTDGSPFDNSACVNSGVVKTAGQTYTVVFPKAGNYKLVCLVHANMTGIVHVLDPGAALPHDQSFYDEQGAAERHDLLSDNDDDSDSALRGDGDRDSDDAHSHAIVTGTGELISTPGGVQSVSLMRFLRHRIVIHAGQTVEWNSEDVTGHTITFGVEPPNVTPATPPSTNVFLDPDGVRHVILNSPSDSAHSGTITQAPQERTGLAQAPPGFTRFRATFINPGTYPFICAFHDDLGMKGEVIVLP